MATIQDSQPTRQNTPASNEDQQAGQRDRDTGTLVDDGETEEVIQGDIDRLRSAERRSALIMERNRLRAAAARAPGTTIAGSSSGQPGGASASPAVGSASADTVRGSAKLKPGPNPASGPPAG